MDPKQNPLQKDEKPFYSRYYDSSLRWVEDTYLKYFGENRTSYGAKGNTSQGVLVAVTDIFDEESLKKTHVTGNKDVDNIQSSAGEAVGDLFGSKGAGGEAGDAIDKNVLRGNV